MAKQEIRWGVIGPGHIADRFGLGIKAVKDTSLQAVASRSLERAENFAKTFRVKQAYDSYQALADDPHIDAVYIATPHRFHYEQARMCLEAGKHVLCEKPFTVNERESQHLFTLAKQRDLFIMEAMWTYFLPIYKQVGEWLDSHAIGEVLLLSSSFGIQPARDPDRRLFNLELAGGSLLDLGIYNLDLSMWVARQEVSSFSVRGKLGSTGVDEVVAGTLEFPSGMLSQFVCSYNFKTDNDFKIYGTKGHIVIHAPFWGATRATLVTESEEKTVTRAYKSGGFEFEIDEACRCIRAGLLESPVMPHRQTMASMRLMDGIRREIGLVYPFE